MKCLKCGNEIVDGMKFCNKCGEPVVEETDIKCKNCGGRILKIGGTKLICSNCKKSSESQENRVSNVLKDFSAEETDIICPDCGSRLKRVGSSGLYCPNCKKNNNKGNNNYKKNSNISIYDIVCSSIVNNTENKVAKGVNKWALTVLNRGTVLVIIVWVVVALLCLPILINYVDESYKYVIPIILLGGIITYCIKAFFNTVALLIRALGEQIHLLEQIKNK